MQTGKKTREMFNRALACMPSGVTSNYRYWGDDRSVVLKRGQGAYIWDQDDKKYLDYRMGFGPVILGHGYPAVLDAIKEALNMGNVFALTHEYEIKAAEKIKALTNVDLVRYANSGTEATMHAIRIARAYTGRNKIVKFEGHYHGFHDQVLWSTFPPLASVGYRKAPIKVCQGSGVPQSSAEMVVMVPFNDEELLEKKVKENWGDIACIIMEPIMGNCASVMPRKGYLEFVRQLCDQYGIVLLFDEVKTGFRVAKGGAQEYFNIRADMATYAKALGNGFPIAAIGGKKEVMADIGFLKIPHGGTYSGNAVATAAACATLDEIGAGALDKVSAHGRRLVQGMNKVLKERGLPGFVLGPDAMPGVVITEVEAVYDYRDVAASNHAIYEQIIWKLLEKGVMPDTGVHEPWFISATHTDKAADFAIGMFDEAVKEVLS
ncbi:MAG: aspartate aminotransferase family protein [Deltaproteobacteria bacterium]|jgi:glutamate-1-semialdehyde 2,1-aminomutase|nr:aspartate aminotransferase family protein [Deltaproteobacteria bacterium]